MDICCHCLDIEMCFKAVYLPAEGIAAYPRIENAKHRLIYNTALCIFYLTAHEYKPCTAAVYGHAHACTGF